MSVRVVADAVLRSTSSKTVLRSPLSLENRPRQPAHFQRPTRHGGEAGAIFLRGRHLSRCHHSLRYEERRRCGIERGSYAAVGLRYRFYVLRPSPSGFELGSAYRASAHFYKLDLSILELANLVGRIEMFNFHLR